MSDYPAGTLAVIRYKTDDMLHADTGRAIRWRYGWLYSDDDGYEIVHDPSVTDVHPLVVLDGTEALHLHDLPKHLRRHVCQVCNDLADSIEAQTRPPKPPEPKGLGAVVEDRDGVRWVRCDDSNSSGLVWHGPSDFARRYSQIDAVTVRNEGDV